MNDLQKAKTSDPRWDLSILYSGITDPNLDKDLAELLSKERKFNADYKGKLGEKLGPAVAEYGEISALANKIFVFLFLTQSTNVGDSAVKAKIADVERAVNDVSGEFLTFFEIEIVGLDDAVLTRLYKNDPILAKHKPWIDHVRIFKPNLLSEPVEAALTKRSSFAAGSWGEFYDEVESDLRFSFAGGEKTLTEMLNIVSTSHDAEVRARALEIVNKGFEGSFIKYSAQTLYMIAGSRGTEVKERGYKNPMEPQNKSNQIPDEVVNALHAAVKDIAGPLTQKYYTLKARLLGVPKLAWSDRNAPLPFDDKNIVPFDEAIALVLQAYESFSPTLAGIVRESIKAKRIDAPATPGKRSGAFNYSVVLPGNIPLSFTLLNYLGSNRDVMTIAHELGHGVHGILAGQAQGPLMFQAPTAYAETASVFGEMITFNFLKKQLAEKNDSKAMLALVTSKIEDAINTIVRQIGFSNFERRLHGMDPAYTIWSEPRKRSAEEVDAIWLTTLEELYGKDGEVFIYKDTSHLWSYVPHFHRPFYVYGYAFGELLTQSLYASRPQLGDRFEPLYLDLLRSGSTKNVIDLLEPFGLNPADPEFWSRGIEVSLGAMIKEAETLI